MPAARGGARLFFGRAHRCCFLFVLCFLSSYGSSDGGARATPTFGGSESVGSSVVGRERDRNEKRRENASICEKERERERERKEPSTAKKKKKSGGKKSSGESRGKRRARNTNLQLSLRNSWNREGLFSSPVFRFLRSPPCGARHTSLFRAASEGFACGKSREREREQGRTRSFLLSIVFD